MIPFIVKKTPHLPGDVGKDRFLLEIDMRHVTQHYRYAQRDA